MGYNPLDTPNVGAMGGIHDWGDQFKLEIHEPNPPGDVYTNSEIDVYDENGKLQFHAGPDGVRIAKKLELDGDLIGKKAVRQFMQPFKSTMSGTISSKDPKWHLSYSWWDSVQKQNMSSDTPPPDSSHFFVTSSLAYPYFDVTKLDFTGMLIEDYTSDGKPYYIPPYASLMWGTFDLQFIPGPNQRIGTGKGNAEPNGITGVYGSDQGDLVDLFMAQAYINNGAQGFADESFAIASVSDYNSDDDHLNANGLIGNGKVNARAGGFLYSTVNTKRLKLSHQYRISVGIGSSAQSYDSQSNIVYTPAPSTADFTIKWQLNIAGIAMSSDAAYKWATPGEWFRWDNIVTRDANGNISNVKGACDPSAALGTTSAVQEAELERESNIDYSNNSYGDGSHLYGDNDGNVVIS